jgi:hypothetical protein
MFPDPMMPILEGICSAPDAASRPAKSPGARTKPVAVAPALKKKSRRDGLFSPFVSGRFTGIEPPHR